MGGAASVPVVSQTVSLAQVIGGDVEGARRTQEEFSRRCPIVSQVRSAVEAATGDLAGAEATQREFVGHLGETVGTTVGLVLGPGGAFIGGAIGGAAQGAIQEATGHIDQVMKSAYGNYALYLMSIPLRPGASLASGATAAIANRRVEHFRVVHELPTKYVAYEYGGGGAEALTSTQFSTMRKYNGNDKGYIVRAWRGISEERVNSVFDTLKKEWRGQDYDVFNHNCQHFCRRMIRELTGDVIRYRD
mmetsp:Transcript_132222/g.329743  ORF Transcript_132222/g.329743 Transcript_132222/m.329743 type:complete len:247 (+) Transcript_132222:42-782(+)